MDQPLDLSQRENSAVKNCVERQIEEDMICEVPSCACPRKHLTMLESPGRSIYESNLAASSNINGPYSAGSFCYDNYTEYNGHKRSSMPEVPNLSMCHPKRRKMEIFKQKLARSVSENELSFEIKNESTLFLGTGNAGRDHIPGFIGKEYSDTQSSYDSSSGKSSPSHLDSQAKSIWKENEIGQENNKESSINHMERLPKKRAHARHLSFGYENSSSNRSSHSGSPVYDKNENFRQRSPIIIQPAGPLLNNEKNENITIQPWNCLPNTSVIKSPIKTLPKLPPVKPLSEKEKSYNDLKADMIREIDNDKDDEDISAFRKRFFKYCTTGAKAISSVMSDKHPGGIRMSALEYLISKTLIQQESTGYKPKNNHIHQIIKGEKPGKLCLMDMVELQVEIGLA